VHDGIAFHSKNRQRLPAVELAGGWLHHALAPEHPIILIEHNDDSSQQTNTCEALVIEALAQTAIAQLRLEPTPGWALWSHTGLRKPYCKRGCRPCLEPWIQSNGFRAGSGS
jgi:hypothetical protein